MQAGAVAAETEVQRNGQSLRTGTTSDAITTTKDARRKAISWAKEHGGVRYEGLDTGFVPQNRQHQDYFMDWMDLRKKAVRLKELLSKPEVAQNFGVATGWAIEKTRGLPQISIPGVGNYGGSSDEVNEAFDLIANLSDKELRVRSKSQTSEKEFKRITGFLIHHTKRASVNLQNLDNMLNTVTANLRTIGVDHLPDSPDSPKSLETPTPIWNRQAPGTVEEQLSGEREPHLVNGVWER